MKEITHLDKRGNPQMVDVNAKAETERVAIAEGKIFLGKEIMDQLLRQDFNSKKGSVVQTAIIAGNMAVKKTSELIPLCHPLAINACTIDIEPIAEDSLKITCKVKTRGKTGVEMEALTGVSVSALTIYDMLKSLSHTIEIKSIKLILKTGGKSDFKRT